MAPRAPSRGHAGHGTHRALYKLQTFIKGRLGAPSELAVAQEGGVRRLPIVTLWRVA